MRNSRAIIVKRIVYLTGTGTVGIGEDQQWFNTNGYGNGNPSTPLMGIYNNWGYSPGTQVFSYLTNSAGLIWSNWYNVSVAYNSASCSTYPDAILAYPNVAVGIADFCPTGGLYFYMNAAAFYEDVIPYPTGSPQGGTLTLGAIESVTSDGNGQRGARPKLARDIYGFLPSSIDKKSGNTTRSSYIYYNDGQWSKNAGSNCGYDDWGSASLRFAVTQLTIDEYTKPCPLVDGR